MIKNKKINKHTQFFIYLFSITYIIGIMTFIIFKNINDRIIEKINECENVNKNTIIAYDKYKYYVKCTNRIVSKYDIINNIPKPIQLDLNYTLNLTEFITG